MAITPRQQSLIDACKTPRTVSELAEEFSTGYYSVRKSIKELVGMSLLSECPWTRGREKLYVTQFALGSNNTIQAMIFSFLSETLTFEDLAQSLDRFKMMANLSAPMPILALSKVLYDYHRRNDEDQLIPDAYPGR